MWVSGNKLPDYFPLRKLPWSERLYRQIRGVKMKQLIVAVIGILMVMLLAIPVIAENMIVDAEKETLSQDADTVTPIAGGRTAEPVPSDTMSGVAEGSSGESGGCGMDTRSPVLDGGAFTSYDTVFFHGTAAEANGGPNADIVYERDYSDGHYVRLKASSSGYYPAAWIDCPFGSYHSKQGGIQPKVRYLGLHYRSDISGAGFPRVDAIEVWNGCSPITTISRTLYTTGSVCTVEVIDLGGWYSFDRGLNMCVHIRSESPYERIFQIGGYGARYEW